MSNIVMNNATGFLNSVAVVRVSSTPKTYSQSFDETLKGLKNDSGMTQSDRADENRPDKFERDKIKSQKMTSSGKRGIVRNEDKLTDEQIAAVSEEVISQIKEIIRERFGVSEEELSETMNSLGMTDENLLNTVSITQLVMKLAGAENQSDFLTNPDLAKDLKELISSLEEIKEKSIREALDAEKQSGLQKESELETIQTADEPHSTEEEADTAEMANQTVTGETEIDGAKSGIADTGEGKSDGLLKHDDTMGETVAEDGSTNNQAIQPQDFAARLTEDLSGRIGEEQATDIVRQVVEQVQVQTKQGITSMEMQIYPEHLGKVLVQVVSKDGQITAQITAETEAAKNALESQLTLLKDNLNNQGVRIENVQVTIASHAFERNMQGESEHEQESGNKNKGRRAGRILEEDFANDFSEEPEIMEARGNTVSYSA